MARIDAIPDGQPLTYETLNSIISEVNKIKDVPENNQQVINVFGPKIKKSDNDTVKIISGQRNFEVKAKDSTMFLRISFDTNANAGTFSNDQVVVTASLMDRETGKKGEGISMSDITIVSVDKKGFEVRFKFMKAPDHTVNLTLNYIAIGPGPTN